MVHQRESDKQLHHPLHHRTEQRQPRGYEINGQWYFELRGGGQKGPFECEADMQNELQCFIQFYEQMSQQN